MHDRESIPSGEVHQENIWGVADEDLYSMALKQFDRIHAEDKPFFAHVMTTSNHRPYTFPEGRVEYPQGKREGTVAYSDWAIGDFLRRARSKPWFANTVFVITADHCAASAGKANLPVFRYHIPTWIYSPANIEPGRMPHMMAQIDIGPSLLGLLGIDYRSSFYGVDIAHLPAGRERAFIGNYQRLGYLHDDQLIQFAPRRVVENTRPDFLRNEAQPDIAMNQPLADDAISYYQSASYRFSRRLMGVEESAPKPAVAGL